MALLAAPVRIGLTGGIGSGKSTVARMWVKRGATLIDTDAIARSLTMAGGVAIPRIRAVFGPLLIDAQGGLDRARMRDRVFADPSAKAQLEAILHPMIGMEVDRQVQTARGPALVFDIPLLVESVNRWRDRVDRILVVDCSEATQVERVMRRSGWSEGTVRAVIAQQASRDARRAIADAVIFNEGLDLAQLTAQVDKLWRLWVPAKTNP